jgi:hypothetical protein
VRWRYEFYAQVLGVVLILIGVVGLVLGERLFLGILNIDIVEDAVHLITRGEAPAAGR